MNNDLEALLAVMRDMNRAAKLADWTALEDLDNRRQSILININRHTLESTKECSEAIVELIQLDQEVLALTNQSLEHVASQVETTRHQSKACQHYQSFSGQG